MNIARLRKGFEEYDQSQINVRDLNSSLLSRQILKNQFNDVLSLVSRNYCFEASIMLNLLSDLNTKISVPSLIPQNHILG